MKEYCVCGSQRILEVTFDLCMDCGKVQGKFPVSTQALRKVFPEY